MKVLVIGGMHGNEQLGLKLVKLFSERPVKNIGTILANELAIVERCRFIKKDLNRSFPGDIKSEEYESRRAAEILQLAIGYDLVLDFHNTTCSGNDCCFLGENANSILYDLVSSLGLKRVIVADYECINKYAPNCLSVEVSVDSELNSSQLWYDMVASLTRKRFAKQKPDLEKYQFVYRITNEDRDRYDLTKLNIKAFQPIDDLLAKKLGVNSPAFPIFINDTYTPYSYGGLLNKSP